jgi:hypothetical protein
MPVLGCLMRRDGGSERRGRNRGTGGESTQKRRRINSCASPTLPPNAGKQSFAACGTIPCMDTAPDFSTLHNTAPEIATDTPEIATTLHDTRQETATETHARMVPQKPPESPYVPLSAPQWLYLLSRLSPAALDEVKAALSSLESCAGRQPRA